MNSELSSLRAEIDLLDEQLWEIIGKRKDVARQIGQWKKLHGQPIVQAARWQEVKDRCHRLAEAQGVSSDCVEEVMQALHQESVRVES